jgi:hypothetical protein
MRPQAVPCRIDDQFSRVSPFTQYIRNNLQPLAEVKDQPEIMASFEKLRRLTQ